MGYKVIDIACGSGDAQTLCITDDDNVWSWGDGDYGKLGRGGSDGCKVRIIVVSLLLQSTIKYHRLYHMQICLSYLVQTMIFYSIFLKAV
jgi:alpha-tubulin suppressor-like RCC1 family protein